LLNYFETGLPFLCFKDNANKANPNAHVGIIRSSNLCTEIFQNRIYLGSEGNLLKPDENNAKRVKISLPIISNEELFEVKALNNF
ncbi:glutamate synthase central domain-containing protein, partial [Campylobacter coli]